MAHALHYGSSVFEGIRCYDTRPDGPAIFRLTDHNSSACTPSAKIYDIDDPVHARRDQRRGLPRRSSRANGNSTDYLRPVAYRGLGRLRLSATPDRRRGRHLEDGRLPRRGGAGTRHRRLRVELAAFRTEHHSRRRQGRRQLSLRQLVAREARRLGFGEGIALASTGLLSEGAGENLFLVFDGALHTTR
jgi:branched-chain amino acid aminotransferase